MPDASIGIGKTKQNPMFLILNDDFIVCIGYFAVFDDAVVDFLGLVDGFQARKKQIGVAWVNGIVQIVVKAKRYGIQFG